MINQAVFRTNVNDANNCSREIKSEIKQFIILSQTASRLEQYLDSVWFDGDERICAIGERKQSTVFVLYE